MQIRTKNILTICFSSDTEVNSFLNTIRDGENPFSFKKILQLSDDPKVNKSRSDLLAYSPCAGKAHSVRGGMKGALEILRNS